MTENSETIVVTGAFSYTGKYVTKLLLSKGYKVRTLTNHPNRENPFGQNIKVFPYSFDNPQKLTESLRGSSVLINTYWIRFEKGGLTFEKAVQNTKILISAAKNGGIKRIVHISIANPSAQSPLGYYKGKAQVEQAITDSGLNYTILRPTIIFGGRDILINNIAWVIRHFPVFGVAGSGGYSVRPVYVEDIAGLIADSVTSQENKTIDAVGPETFTFDGLIKIIAEKIGRAVHIIHLPLWMVYMTNVVAGWFVGDVIVTWDEYKALMANLLAPQGPTTCQTRLSDWLSQNRDTIGKKYASEIARHYVKKTVV